MFRVFLGAPSRADLAREASTNSNRTYRWETVESQKHEIETIRQTSTAEILEIYPPATLEAASRRISLLYQNIIFNDVDDELELEDTEVQYEGMFYFVHFDGSLQFFLSDQTTRITDGKDISTIDPSLLPSFLNSSKSLSDTFDIEETQESVSYNYSDASSIARFPTFHFSLHSLTSLSSLTGIVGKESKKATLLLAVLEVEGPDTIRIKKGADAGKEVSILKTILGDEDGNVCKLTAWRDVADSWGGVKRGDVVLIESESQPTFEFQFSLIHLYVSLDVTVNYEPGTTPTLTASPYLKSKLEICYRTMPYTHEDGRLRPDLRLGISDAAVRKVASVVAWFEGMAGLVRT